MNQILAKTLGGLRKEYLFRQYFFGFLIAAFIFWMSSRSKAGISFAVVVTVLINTVLYPYSRFVYESIVDFIFGDNVFFVSAIVMLMVKVMTMVICFIAALLIAPIGLVYLYYHHSKQQPN